MSEVGEEQFSGRFFKEGMTDVCYSPELRQAVAAGPTSIKVSVQDKLDQIIQSNRGASYDMLHCIASELEGRLDDICIYDNGSKVAR